MLDADADICRRAWVACARCRDHEACPTCREGRSCESHWRYLLATDGRWLFVQCRTCLQRWWLDTRFGVGGRPLTLDDTPGLVADGHAAFATESQSGWEVR